MLSVAVDDSASVIVVAVVLVVHCRVSVMVDQRQLQFPLSTDSDEAFLHC